MLKGVTVAPPLLRSNGGPRFAGVVVRTGFDEYTDPEGVPSFPPGTGELGRRDLRLGLDKGAPCGCGGEVPELCNGLVGDRVGPIKADEEEGLGGKGLGRGGERPIEFCRECGGGPRPRWLEELAYRWPGELP